MIEFLRNNAVLEYITSFEDWINHFESHLSMHDNDLPLKINRWEEATSNCYDLFIKKGLDIDTHLKELEKLPLNLTSYYFETRNKKEFCKLLAVNYESLQETIKVRKETGITVRGRKKLNPTTAKMIFTGMYLSKEECESYRLFEQYYSMSFVQSLELNTPNNCVRPQTEKLDIDLYLPIANYNTDRNSWKKSLKRTMYNALKNPETQS